MLNMKSTFLISKSDILFLAFLEWSENSFISIQSAGFKKQHMNYDKENGKKITKDSCFSIRLTTERQHFDNYGKMTYFLSYRIFSISRISRTLLTLTN